MATRPVAAHRPLSWALAFCRRHGHRQQHRMRPQRKLDLNRRQQSWREVRLQHQHGGAVIAEHHIGSRRRPGFLAHKDARRAPADRTLQRRHFVKRLFRHRRSPPINSKPAITASSRPRRCAVVWDSTPRPSVRGRSAVARIAASPSARSGAASKPPAAQFLQESLRSHPAQSHHRNDGQGRITTRTESVAGS